jgi:transcriptional regulator with XRE-family HTH domain
MKKKTPATQPQISPELLVITNGVNDQITKIMERRNMSKSQLAAAMGTSQPYISRISKGDVNFSLSSLLKIADAIDCELVVKFQKKR